MNKLLIIFLAVCLISVHAFVKRDAEAAPSGGTVLEEVSKQFEEMKKKLEENFKPENVKKEVNDFIDNVTKFVNNMKTNSEPPK